MVEQMKNGSSAFCGDFPERISVTELPSFPDHIGRYRFALQWVPGARVLDLCCGTGYGSVLMAAAGAASVQGVDISPEALAEAQQRAVFPGLRFSQGDALKLEFQAEFDLITCFEGLEHVTDPAGLVRNTARALDTGGTLIISTPNGAAQENGHSGNPFHVHELRAEEFSELMRAHFRQVKLYYQRRNDPLDEEWSTGRAVRGMVRGLIPNALRKLLSRSDSATQVPSPAAGGPAASAPDASAAAQWIAPDVRDRYYPRPWSYLSYPGFEPDYVPPTILAVCRDPINSSRGR